MTLAHDLRRLHACQEAINWVGDRDLPTAWRECPRCDWMLWLLRATRRSDKVRLVRVACAIARTVLHLVPAGEDRPRLEIEAAERWADDPTKEHRIASAHAAAAAAADAAADAAAYAAADAAAYAAARSQHAAIVRQFFPEPPEIEEVKL